MRRYETFYISDRERERIEEINSRVKEVVEQNQGEYLKDEDWGDRQLAYSIGKLQRGKYIRLVYELSPAQIGEVNRVLKFQDGVIRFQTYLLQGDGPAAPYEPPESFRREKVFPPPSPESDTEREAETKIKADPMTSAEEEPATEEGDEREGAEVAEESPDHSKEGES